ncbi:MAG: MarR family transcriptional regulator [Deltaproteobacteria bacterium]|nr:MarR family transcriptional regulator [Deltaproteobacteria bacterium]
MIDPADPDDERTLGPTLALLRRLWALDHALESGSKRMLRELGLTAQQRFVLRLVGRFPGITPSRLAAMLQVDPGTLSAALRRLERRKLVARRRDERDHRRVHLGLTREGRALDVPVERTVERGIERVLATTPRAEIDVADRVLRRIAEALLRTFDDA